MEREFIVTWDNSADHPHLMENALNRRKFRDPKTWEEVFVPENYKLVSAVPASGMDKLNTTLFIWKREDV